jgi:hypothetical protein
VFSTEIFLTELDRTLKVWLGRLVLPEIPVCPAERVPERRLDQRLFLKLAIELFR